MLRRPLHELHRRLGDRYPAVALVLVLVQAHAVVLAAVLILTRFLALPSGGLLLLITTSQALTLAENVLVMATAWFYLRPLRAWEHHEGDDDEQPGTASARATEAWRALTRLPLRLVGTGAAVRTLIWATVMIVAICLVADLNLWPSGAVLVLAATVVLLAGVLIRYLEVELVLRPVVEAVAPGLDDDAPLDRSLSLRWRLLVGVPLITVVTGGVVASFSTSNRDLSDFGIGIAIALASSATIALLLSALLVRSFVAPLDELRETTTAIAGGDLDRPAVILAGDEIGRLARQVNIGLRGLRERDRLHEAFGTYVDPAIASRVLDEGPQLAGTVIEVTVAFIDIRGFTSFAEQSTPTEVFGVLNEFYGVIVPVIERYGGHANTFQGDGLLAVFGAPTELEDHADRAVTASIEVARAVRQHFGGDLRLGIGINSGPVVAGTIGGGNRAAFTVIGDPVNTASRVEQITRQTGDVVLFTEETRRRLKRDHGTISARPPAPVRGKRIPVRLHAPLLGGRVEDPLPTLEDGLGRLLERPDAGPPGR
ncbi:adenylate/guanylate cyclase domain-containing protein [Patulibacter sp. NPDC049589]|uniref:adenylate/guanylate cyclase domain-containing protein n=1 Tax=Patulibacter sp. NPDC049589 TaxID=3154731 RepID=UPI003446E31C